MRMNYISLISLSLKYGHVLIHQFDETIVVGLFQQMHQFIHDDVLQTLPWLFGKIDFRRMLLAMGLQLPHLVFMRRTETPLAFTDLAPEKRNA